jgi:signal transduction histidine kinase
MAKAWFVIRSHFLSTAHLSSIYLGLESKIMTPVDRDEAAPFPDLPQVGAYIESARSHRYTDLDRAHRDAQLGLELLRKLQTPQARYEDEEAELLVLLGSFERQIGQIESAVIRTLAALKLMAGKPVSRIACDAWICLGWAYTNIGEFSYALRYSLQGLKTARALGIRGSESHALDVLGCVYAIFGDSDEALRHFETAESSARETGDRRRLCSVLNNLAMTLLGREEHAAALRAARESLSIAREDAMTVMEPNVIDTVASVLVAMGDLPEAESCLVPAVSEARKREPSKVLANLLNNLGSIRAASGDPVQAESLFGAALEIASRIGDPVLELRCHKRLADLFAAGKSWQEAYGAFRKYHEVYETIAGAKAAKRLTVVRIANELDALPDAIEPSTARGDGTVGALETLTARLQARNRELVEMKRAAEVASKTKSRFLSNMSHELKTPLSGVLGMAELLLRTPLNDTQERYCRTILKSGQSLNDLVTDILDYTSMEAGRLVLETVELEPAHLVAGVADSLRPAASARGLHVECKLGDALPRALLGDAKRIRQVLQHVAANAVKFTMDGVVELGVSCLPPQSGDLRTWLRFSVSDTGIGIGPEAAAVLFKPFVQADDSLSRQHGGSGLGLAISKHLVELMGGTIDFRSQPAKGSTFWFDLPLRSRSVGTAGSL